MGNFHIKSVILGIGIGAILTAVISMIYISGMDPRQKLSEAEIIRLASELGMVQSTSIIQSGPSGDQKQESGRQESEADDSRTKPKTERKGSGVPDNGSTDAAGGDETEQAGETAKN